MLRHDSPPPRKGSRIEAAKIKLLTTIRNKIRRDKKLNKLTGSWSKTSTKQNRRFLVMMAQTYK